MNDLDLCLEVVWRSCQPLRYIRRWISRKPLEIEAWFQRITNRKWHMGYQMVTWPMTSRDPERWCEAVRSAILATAWLLAFSCFCPWPFQQEATSDGDVNLFVCLSVARCEPVRAWRYLAPVATHPWRNHRPTINRSLATDVRRLRTYGRWSAWAWHRRCFFRGHSLYRNVT